MSYKEFAKTLLAMPPEQSLAALKAYLSDITDESFRAEAHDYLMSFRTGDDAPPVVFVLLHGIRTDAPWQDALAQQLRTEHQITAIPLKYGVFNTFRFLIPALRHKAVDLVSRHFDDVKALYPDAKLVVIAHSFGSYLVGEILKKKRHNMDRLLLCGSVLPPSFDWRQVMPAGRPSTIINDVGTKDLLPVLAHATSIGCGASGYTGFGNACVTDRYHDLGHSGFFEEEHIKRFWIPFLVEGRVVPSTHTMDRKSGGYFPGLACSLHNGCLFSVAVAIVFVYCIW